MAIMRCRSRTGCRQPAVGAEPSPGDRPMGEGVAAWWTDRDSGAGQRRPAVACRRPPGCRARAVLFHVRTRWPATRSGTRERAGARGVRADLLRPRLRTPARPPAGLSPRIAEHSPCRRVGSRHHVDQVREAARPCVVRLVRRRLRAATGGDARRARAVLLPIPPHPDVGPPTTMTAVSTSEHSIFAVKLELRRAGPPPRALTHLGTPRRLRGVLGLPEYARLSGACVPLGPSVRRRGSGWRR